MPKIINHENQKEKIAAAAHRIIRKDGMENATVRNIAKEAGLSMGAMRYYFSSQQQLYIFCMESIIKRYENRILGLKYPPSDPPLDHIKRILYQLLPLDEERLLDTEVWLAFKAKALSYSELQPLSKKMYDDSRILISKVLDLMIEFGITKPNLNIQIEIDRLNALVDGLSLHCITDPNYMTHKMVDLILTNHLELLCISTDGKIDYPKK